MDKTTCPVCEMDEILESPTRLVEGDHEITCKMDGITVFLKARFVKKV